MPVEDEEEVPAEEGDYEAEEGEGEDVPAEEGDDEEVEKDQLPYPYLAEGGDGEVHEEPTDDPWEAPRRKPGHASLLQKWLQRGHRNDDKHLTKEPVFSTDCVNGRPLRSHPRGQHAMKQVRHRHKAKELQLRNMNV